MMLWRCSRAGSSTRCLGHRLRVGVLTARGGEASACGGGEARLCHSQLASQHGNLSFELKLLGTLLLRGQHGLPGSLGGELLVFLLALKHRGSGANP